MGRGYALLPAAEVQDEIDAGRLIATPIVGSGLRRTLCVVRANTKAVSPVLNDVFELIRSEGIVRPPDQVEGRAAPAPVATFPR